MYKETKQWKSVDDFVAAANAYMAEFAKLPKEEAKKIAQESLIRCGVLNPDGSVKENIVTQPHLHG